MGQNFIGTLFPQQMPQDFVCLGTYFHGGRIIVIGLTDIGVLEALNGGQGVCLGSRGKSPGTGRGTDQVQRFLTRLEKTAEKIAVEVAKNQPLWAAGRPGHDLDIVRPQSAVPDFCQGLFSGFEYDINVQGITPV